MSQYTHYRMHTEYDCSLEVSVKHVNEERGLVKCYELCTQVI